MNYTTQKNTLLLLVVFLGLFFSSCEKEIDDWPPNVTFAAPTENAFFNFEDTIPIRATISDNVNIERVIVRVRSTGGVTVLGDITFFPNAREFNLEVDLPFDNKYAESGDHFITIIVSDGTNEVQRSRKIFLAGLPLERRWIAIAQQVGNNTLRIDTIGRNFNVTAEFTTLSSDFLGMAAFSREGNLVICGSRTGNITGLKMENASQVFSIQNNNSSSSDFFSGFSFNPNEREFVLANLLFEMRGYTANGAGKFTANLPAQRFAVNSYTYPDRIVFAFRNSANQFFIKSFVKPSTLVLGEYQLPNTFIGVPGIFHKSRNEVYIVSREQNNVSRIFLHGLPPQNTFVPLMNFNNPVTSVERWDTNRALIGTTNGVLIFDFSTNTPTSLVFGVNVKKLRIDRANNWVFVLTQQNVLRAYDLTTGFVTFARTFGQNMVDFELLYNK